MNEPDRYWEVFNTKTGIVVSTWRTENMAEDDKRRRDEKYADIDPSWILEVRETVTSS